jgi:hypothetical protein
MSTFVRRATGAVLIGALGAIVVACGGSGPVVPSGALPSIDINLPSNLPTLPTITLNPDQGLADRFPDTIGGQPVNVTSAQGESVRGMFSGTDTAEFDDFLRRINASIDQLSAGQVFMLFPIASGSTELVGLSMLALQVRGAQAETTLANLATLIQQDAPDSEISTTTIGGKGVTSVLDPADPESAAYLYASGDVVWMIGGTPSLVEEAFTKIQ